MKKTLMLITMLSALNVSQGFAENTKFITYDSAALEYNKDNLNNKAEALSTLIAKADKALKADIDPVTNKTLLPASGDPHDYFSFGPYWWPNPDTKDGLPYIRRDGEYNMATKTAATDKQRFIRFTKDVTNLGLAYYFTGKNDYASKAIDQLKAWFIDQETRMNPNLNHAQAIPGIVDGRGIGIIDSRLLIGVVDSVEILKAQLTSEQYTAINNWFKEFNTWLITSNNGFEEDNWHNNHGTWYDAQVVAFAIFTGDLDTAKKRLRVTQMRRIGTQFNMHGQQHAELERTKPWHYSNFNLQAYSLLGHYGDVVGIDVWNYEVDKHSLKKGYQYVAKYTIAPEEWDYKELKGFQASKAYTNMLYANKAYNDPIFSDAISELKKDKANQKNIQNLLFK
ncbi:alginate lyase family protein [Agarivorans litoreus]|uniref:alginate lyase family protein n=1 Tax=Agarivorans litoreus TaxID=1510455 RepID=UPI001C7DB032|nr:alginate lyase family protein [Agarivorans litoreus]